jgi:hypothetical protein
MHASGAFPGTIIIIIIIIKLPNLSIPWYQKQQTATTAYLIVLLCAAPPCWCLPVIQRNSSQNLVTTDQTPQVK